MCAFYLYSLDYNARTKIFEILKFDSFGCCRRTVTRFFVALARCSLPIFFFFSVCVYILLRSFSYVRFYIGVSVFVHIPFVDYRLASRYSYSNIFFIAFFVIRSLVVCVFFPSSYSLLIQCERCVWESDNTHTLVLPIQISFERYSKLNVFNDDACSSVGLLIQIQSIVIRKFSRLPCGSWKFKCSLNKFWMQFKYK